jgi:hypothetical protein
MITPGSVICPKCTEDRPTLIHLIVDPRGPRYVCMVCSCEFLPPNERPQ